MRRRLAWFTVVAMLSGCGPATGTAEEPEPVPSRPGAAENLQRLRERAQVVLANYEAAMGANGFVVLQGQESAMVGTLEARNEQLKTAIGAGRFEPVGTLPPAPRETGEVVWGNGERLKRPLMSAPEGLRKLAARDDCPQCARHPVTGARLTTMTVATTRGKATVPAWEYSLADTEVRVKRMALETGGPATVAPPAGNPDEIPEGSVAEAVRVDGRKLTADLTGAQEGADKPCGEDFVAETVETDIAVAIIIQRIPYSGPEPSVPPGAVWACTLVGYPRTVTATLKKPLNGRAVLEVQQGQPVLLKEA
ncbi:hypothetical protein JIG36_13435 [Actinoplanes sp. LDG1-06]|uniref:Lipoprotein n=1 Tax=Paractinoplanes ovalisporus TaxID=2810368 RepID=A0ABS2A9P7_9ACTN|nr:hypothetical protein [Actinoplanes ovalisporus]MBM2616561.1 hypothetical protein [Actinoplanes ovalisporus]